MNGIRIDLDLSAFFTDIRKFSRVYLTYYECLTIKDVEEHIKQTFNITETIVLLSDKYLLPSSQSVNILQPSEHVRVIHGDAVQWCSENEQPSISGNSINKSYCVNSTPCCMSKNSKREYSELYSNSSKRKRNSVDVDVNILSEQDSIDKNDKHKEEKQLTRTIDVLNGTGSAYEFVEGKNGGYKYKKKLGAKVGIFSINGKNETRKTISVKKISDCSPVVVLKQVSGFVDTEIAKGNHINCTKRKKMKTEDDLSKETLDSIQTGLSDAVAEAVTKHKKKKTENVTNCKNIDGIQMKLNTLSNAGEVVTKHKKKKTSREVFSDNNQVELITNNGAEINEIEVPCVSEETMDAEPVIGLSKKSITGTKHEKMTNSEMFSDNNQIELCAKNDTEINEIEVSCASDSKNEETTETEPVMALKKSRKRIRKRKAKNKKLRNLYVEGTKMLYDKIRTIGESEMITTAELKPELKQNIHIFFDDDLGDNMLSISVGEEPHMTEPFQTSNQNVTANSDSNQEGNILPPRSLHDNGVLPLDVQDILANQNKFDSAKIKESVNRITSNEELEEASVDVLNSNLLTLINNIQEKPPVFERKKKASAAEKCHENVHELQLLKTNDHDYIEKRETETPHGPDKLVNGLAVSSASEKSQETRQSEVELVKSSSTKFDINAYPIVKKFNLGDTILFKILQLNESYEPVLSGYIFAKVLEVSDEKSLLKLEILRGHRELKKKLPLGKFSIYDDILSEEENSNSNIKEIECSRIVEPRLLYP